MTQTLTAALGRQIVQREERAFVDAVLAVLATQCPFPARVVYVAETHEAHLVLGGRGPGRSVLLAAVAGHWAAQVGREYAALSLGRVGRRAYVTRPALAIPDNIVLGSE